MIVMFVGGRISPLVIGAHTDLTQLTLGIYLIQSFSKFKSEAHKNKHVDMLTANRIKTDRYVDNLSRFCSPKEVARFMGKETDDQFQQDGTIPNMLSKRSLKMKVMVNSGETILSKIGRLGDKVLDFGLNGTTDKLIFKFQIQI